jgi:hypothetical protein
MEDEKGRTCSMHGEKRNKCIQYFSTFGRPRGIWEDNIKMDLREIGWEIVDRIDLA